MSQRNVTPYFVIILPLFYRIWSPIEPKTWNPPSPARHRPPLVRMRDRQHGSLICRLGCITRHPRGMSTSQVSDTDSVLVPHFLFDPLRLRKGQWIDYRMQIIECCVYLPAHTICTRFYVGAKTYHFWRLFFGAWYLSYYRNKIAFFKNLVLFYWNVSNNSLSLSAQLPSQCFDPKIIVNLAIYSFAGTIV